MNNYTRVCVCGSRSITSYEYIEKMLLKIQKEFNITFSEIVSGTCYGPDRLGETFAAKHGIKISRFPADWKRFGISAGFKRNCQMAEYSDVVIAFWDKKSKGTKHMIEYSKGVNKIVVEVFSEEEYVITSGR